MLIHRGEGSSFPYAPALDFMREIGAALQPGTPRDPDSMRGICTRHASRLLP